MNFPTNLGSQFEACNTNFFYDFSSHNSFLWGHDWFVKFWALVRRQTPRDIHKFAIFSPLNGCCIDLSALFTLFIIAYILNDLKIVVLGG